MKANGNLGGVPILGQQQEQIAAMAHQISVGMFISLFPQLAVFRAAHGYRVEGGLREESTAERVAEEVAEFVAAGMARMGFRKE